jgi:hypothetical protein
MAASILINTFATEFSKFGNFMFDHVRKTMAADPDAEMPDVDEMVRLYLQPDAVSDVKIKKPRAKPTISAEVTQVPAASNATEKGKAGKGGNKEKCTAVTGKGTQCTRCATQGQVFCLVHLKASQAKSSDKTKKTRAPPKKKSEDMPKHTHPIDEVPETGSCDLCSTHGNPLNEEDAESHFEVKEEEIEVEETADPDPDYILEEEEFDED